MHLNVERRISSTLEYTVWQDIAESLCSTTGDIDLHAESCHRIRRNCAYIDSYPVHPFFHIPTMVRLY